MRRRLLLASMLFLITISAATGVQASTDCQRWINEYKDALAHSRAVQRARAASYRLHHYMHRKLAVLNKPKQKPHTLPVRHRRPKMNREEMLRRFELACGDLPIDLPVLGTLPSEPIADYLPYEPPVEIASNDGGVLPMTIPPPYKAEGVDQPYTSGPPVNFFTPPVGGFMPPGGNPPPPNTPPVTPVPEPSSVALVLTGLSGVAEIIRRRAAK